jgi:subtilisin
MFADSLTATTACRIEPCAPALQDEDVRFTCGLRRFTMLHDCRRFVLVVALALIGGFEIAAAPPAQVDVLISFKNPPGPNGRALIRGQGGTVKETFWLVPAVAARVPLAAVEALRKNPNVDVVEPDGEVLADDLELDRVWGVKRIGAGVVHANGYKGTGVKVAVLDTGIDYTHPDLDANVAGGWDFVNNDNDPRDDHGHGTHIAGTIAAEDNDIGVVGVAPEVELYAVKVLNSSGSGSWSKIISGLQWCVQNGIQVTNNSYGSTSNPGSTVRNAFDNASAAGVVIVASAGNSGTKSGTEDNVNYPARFDSVIAVGATNSNNSRASWSSTGPTVELAAPGVSIRSTLPGGGYGGKSGTSMACPHVVGVAALVIGAGAGDWNGNGIISDDVRMVLDATAYDLGTSGGDAWYGFGLVDAASAVSLVLSSASPGS